VGTAPSADFHETSLAPLWDFRPRDADTGLRRALKDPVETGRHSLRIVAIVVVTEPPNLYKFKCDCPRLTR